MLMKRTSMATSWSWSARSDASKSWICSWMSTVWLMTSDIVGAKYWIVPGAPMLVQLLCSMLVVIRLIRESSIVWLALRLSHCGLTLVALLLRLANGLADDDPP